VDGGERLVKRLVQVSAAAVALWLVLGPVSIVHAQPAVVFGEPTARAVIGEPITLTSQISGPVESVDVVLRLEGNETSVIVDAQPAEPAGTWQVQQEIDIAGAAYCACVLEAPSAPNTRFEYQFRAHSADGSVTLGPLAEAVVEDDRFEWRTLEQGVVVVHWYAGDDAFAADVAQIANGAVDEASELLGVTMTDPVDFFVYDTQQALLEAVSPTRENIAGQFNPAIDTMFGHIPADQSAGAFAGEIVRHELTHWVFEEATENPYHAPPRWLDEGVAVYLSAGYTPYWRAPVDAAVADANLIPLQGLRGLFPSTADGFYLGYGEGVAAVDFFVRTYGEPRLWELVNSYSEGLSDDEAFTRATGVDVEEFNRLWFESLGLVPPGPAGPQPGQPGREPADWEGHAPATPAPSGRPGATSSATLGPPSTSAPAAPTAASGQDLSGPLVIAGLLTLVLVGGGVALIAARQYGRSQRPPAAPPAPPPGPPPL
jgi:hypothetical protein